jgi:cobalamin biosynthesis protein CobT
MSDDSQTKPPEDSTEPESQQENNESSQDKALSLAEAQDIVEEVTEDLFDHSFDGIIKAETTEEGGWRTLVELVERSAIPDTQDIIGRYEITLDHSGSVEGYELRERYQRGDMKEEI